MSPRLATLAFVGALAGCGAPDAPAPIEAAPAPTEPAITEPSAPPPPKERDPVESPTTPEAFVGKHVLVEIGTPLLVAAKPDAARIVMRKRNEHDVRARAFEVVDHENGFLALVRAKPESRCDDGLPELDAYDPKLFVAPEQVGRVLAREATASFPDGTSVSLRPGVFVGDGGLDAGGLAIAFAVDSRDVGTAFTPTMAARPEAIASRVARDQRLRYGEHELVVGSALFGDDRGALALSETADGADSIVEVLNGCATVRARTKPGDVAEPASPRSILGHAALSAGILGGSGASIVVAGAPVTWADGTPAGKLPAEQHFALGTEAKARKGLKGKKCFRVDEPDARVEPFEICVPRKHVTTYDPFGSMASLGAFGTIRGEEFGMIGMLDSSGEPIAGLLGSGGLEGGLGGIDSASGIGGLGSRGFGSGGGGSAEGFGGLGSSGGSADVDVPKAADVRMRSGSVFVDGALEASTVKAKIATSRAGVEYCAESQSPVATGTLSVTLVVGADGEPSAVNVSGIPAIDDCVQRSIERWKLAKSDGTTTATFEITLALEDP